MSRPKSPPAPEPARWADGAPANLPAAAADALEWLAVLKKSHLRAFDCRFTPTGPENRRRLDRCIAALEAAVAPHRPAPAPEPPEAAS